MLAHLLTFHDPLLLWVSRAESREAALSGASTGVAEAEMASSLFSKDILISALTSYFSERTS